MGDPKRDTMLANFAISGGPQVSAAMGGLLAERDRLQARVAWLRRAYGKSWLRRRSMGGIIRDVDNARRSAKTERDRLRAVVDADPLWKPVLVVLANIDAAPQDSDVFELSASPAVTELRAALQRRRELLNTPGEATDG